jgi:protein-S-isoprenylcysteine O-methyltransferase Ste14
MVQSFFRWYPLAFGLLYLGSTLLRAWLVGRKLNLNPIMLRFDKLDAHTVMVYLLSVVYSLIGLQIVLFTTNSPAYEFVGPFHGLEQPWVHWLGFLLTIIPWSFIWLAQNNLGTSWRLGIDEEHDNSLQTRGLYQRVRHPIYTAMMTISFGLFLLMPSALSFSIALFSVVGLHIEAIMEERYLTRVHGNKYREYLGTTGRWLPWI